MAEEMTEAFAINTLLEIAEALDFIAERIERRLAGKPGGDAD